MSERSERTIRLSARERVTEPVGGRSEVPAEPVGGRSEVPAERSEVVA